MALPTRMTAIAAEAFSLDAIGPIETDVPLPARGEILAFLRK